MAASLMSGQIRPSHAHLTTLPDASRPLLSDGRGLPIDWYVREQAVLSGCAICARSQSRSRPRGPKLPEPGGLCAPTRVKGEPVGLNLLELLAPDEANHLAGANLATRNETTQSLRLPPCGPGRDRLVAQEALLVLVALPACRVQPDQRRNP